MSIQEWLQRTMAPLPVFYEKTQNNALSALCLSMAVMAFISLNPYFLWSHQKGSYALASLLIITAFLLCWRQLSFSKPRVCLMLGFTLFLVYLSLLPKVSGGYTRWFFLIPFTVSLLALRRNEMERVFGVFYWVFAISLIPGMALWIWMAAGLPITFVWMTPPSEIVQRGVTDYFMIPGAIVLPSNAQMLPHGGVIFRLCGVYDEPGTVGTIAGLFLAAARFSLRDPRGAIAFTAGIMSFSIAFAIIVVLGLLATAIAARKWALTILALITAIAGGLGSGVIPMKFEVAIRPDIAIIDNQAQGATPSIKSGTPVDNYGLNERTRLRFSSVFDNRAQPEMRQLFSNYLQSPATALLLGIASDASNKTGGSSVWYMILTNYGLVGFVWLFILFLLPLLTLWRMQLLSISAVVFCMVFLLSFYQRPVIWLPAQLTLYFAGISMLQKTKASEA